MQPILAFAPTFWVLQADGQRVTEPRKSLAKRDFAIADRLIADDAPHDRHASRWRAVQVH